MAVARDPQGDTMGRDPASEASLGACERGMDSIAVEDRGVSAFREWPVLSSESPLRPYEGVQGDAWQPYPTDDHLSEKSAISEVQGGRGVIRSSCSNSSSISSGTNCVLTGSWSRY